MRQKIPGSTLEWHQARQKPIPSDTRVQVVGILNVTPDSFFDGGRYWEPAIAIDHALAMVEEGADLIDVGAESTRPGSEPITEEEEIRRLEPVLQGLGRRLSVPFSVDTTKAAVARRAVACGASVINDISALRFDPEMSRVVESAKVGIILMHMKGTPATMQQECSYSDVVQEVKQFLANRIDEAQNAGIEPERIIIDPGIGFGKNLNHNLMLVSHLSRFRELKKPVMVGVSNKSFIGQIVKKDVSDRLMGTAAAVATAVLQGADLIRVHDVAKMRDVVRVAEALRTAQDLQMREEDA